jgi:hypothetical protein
MTVKIDPMGSGGCEYGAMQYEQDCKALRSKVPGSMRAACDQRYHSRDYWTDAIHDANGGKTM